MVLLIVTINSYYKPKMFDINTMEFKNFVKTLESTKTNDDKEVHTLPRGSSESVTPSTKTPFLRCKRCCDKVRIHSSNVAAELYPHLLGIYQCIEASTYCHPPTYKWAIMYEFLIISILFCFQNGWNGKVHCQAKETQKVNTEHFIMFYAKYPAEGNTPGESILTPPLPGAGWGLWRVRSVLMTSSTGESGVRSHNNGSRTPPSPSDVLRSCK